MLNSIFSTAIVAIPAAYLAIGFALHIAACWNRTAPQAIAPVPAPASVPTPAPAPAPAAPSVERTWADAIVPFRRPLKSQQVNWASLPSVALRKECQQRGIKWRGVSNGKHLSKPAMVEALRAIAA